MLFDASSLRRAPALLLMVLFAVALFSLAGCSEEEVVEPFKSAPINHVMDGDSTSVDFLFEVDAPVLEYARDDVAIVSSGKRKHFLVGPDIEHNYATWANGRLRVQKRFSHRVDTTHLVMHSVVNGTVVDTLQTVESYTLPALFQASESQMKTPGAPLPDLSWKKFSMIEEYYPENDGDPLVEVQSVIMNLVYTLRHDLTEEQADAPGADDYAWYAVFPQSTFMIVDLGPGAEWMFELLQAENLPVVGSFSISNLVDSARERRVDHPGLGHICGELTINWFKYANTFVRGED